MDHRLLLGFPNRIGEATLSGGSWTAGLPLDNLKLRQFSKVARSTSAAVGATTFTLDLGQPRKMRMLALIGHNIGLQGRVRFEVSDNADLSSPLYDTETDVWGGLLTAGWDINELEWEADNFWIGTYSKEDIEGFTATSIHILPQPVSGRYVRVSIIDTSNSDGFVQMGRFFVSPALQPKINYSWGAGLNYEISTAVEAALGGSEFFDVREPIRVFRFMLEYMEDNEAFGTFLELIRRAGIDKEILVVPDPTDALNGVRRNFVGRIRQPSALEQVTWANSGSAHSMAFEIKELR